MTRSRRFPPNPRRNRRPFFRLAEIEMDPPIPRRGAQSQKSRKKFEIPLDIRPVLWYSSHRWIWESSRVVKGDRL